MLVSRRVADVSLQGRECFLKVYLRVLMVITRKNLGSYALKCFGVACSKVEQWSVQCTCEITFVDVNLVGVFI